MQINRIKMLLGILLLIIIASVYSCDNNSVAPAVLTADCDTTNLTYTDKMQLVISINCGTLNTSCHAFGTNHDLSTYPSLQKYASGGQNSRFWQEIFILKKMPLYPELPLDLCTSNQFKIWLLNGAPE